MTSVKVITKEDVNNEFISSLATAFPVEDDNPKWTTEHTDKFVADQHNLLLVGYTNDQMSGYLYGYALDRLDDKKKFFVYELSTNKDFRRQGVMSTILDYLFKKLQNDNFDSVWIPTERDNVAAVALYQKMGGVMRDGEVSFEYKLK